ncbi:MAG: S-layer homology domain-containing protein, partial [Clostridia bacterium]|nr:S-layer homology domain-containing protein [Clostridia bacterium]
MKLRKIISMILCVSMLLSAAAIGMTANAAEELPFTDVPDTWYTEAVASVYSEGIMKGKTETTFDPTAKITRAEVVTAFARVAIAKTAGKGDALPFNDTVAGQWYSESVGWAAANGIVAGRGDGRFSPADNITRAELASILTKFIDYMGVKLPDNAKIDSFKDADTFDSWMNAPIEAVRKNGLMQGTDGKFNPRGNATRAEIAQVIKNLLPDVGRQTVVLNGKSDYVIVIDKDNAAAADAAERLQYQIKYNTGAVLDIVDDSAKAASKEIVIGDVRNNPIDKTNLTGDGYEVAIKDGKVYVNAADADGLYRGVVRFAKAAVNGDDVRFTAKTAEREEFSYPIGKLTINGNDISKYQILYPANASANTMTGVNDLVEYIEKACGVKLNAKAGTSGDYAIIVKEETLKLKDAGNDVDSFSVKSSGNSIILTGAAERGAMYACYDFLEDVIGWCFMTDTQDYLEPVESLDIVGLDYSEKSVFMHREDYWGTYIQSQDMENKHKLWQIPHTGGKQHTFQSLTDGQYDQSTQPCLSD